MTFSTQLQDSTKLFSHIFCFFCLFLELQNLVVFEKAVYKITNVLKFCREYIWSFTRVAKKRITLFLSERKKKKREKKKENYFLVWTGFKTITLYSLIKSNYFYNRLLNQSEDAEHVTLQFEVDCFWADFQWGRETKIYCFGAKEMLKSLENKLHSFIGSHSLIIYHGSTLFLFRSSNTHPNSCNVSSLYSSFSSNGKSGNDGRII